MPAPVFSRSSLTREAVISAMSHSVSRFYRSPPLRGLREGEVSPSRGDGGVTSHKSLSLLTPPSATRAPPLRGVREGEEKCCCNSDRYSAGGDGSAPAPSASVAGTSSA